jgi:hypothetical protein
VQALLERVNRDERFQLRHEIAVAASHKLGIDTPLQRSEARLLEPSHIYLNRRLKREIRQRLAAPEGKGAA